MRATAGDRRRAGLLVLVAAGLLAALLVLSAGLDTLTGGTHYVVVFPGSVNGLAAKSPVTYAGLPIGTVQAIRPLGGEAIGSVAVDVELDPDVELKEDVGARLQPKGITGTLQLELHGGTAAADELDPGEVVRGEASPSLTEALARAEHVLGQISALLERNQQALDEALQAGRDVALEARRATREAAGALEDVRTLLADPATRRLPGELEATVIAVREAAEGVQRLEGSLARAAESLEVTASAGRTHLPPTLENVRAMSRDLQAAARSVRQDPSRLIRGGGGGAPRPREFPDPLPPAKEAP